MPGDDLTQQLADQIDRWQDFGDLDSYSLAAAVLARRDLVVPTSDVLNLAQQWDERDRGTACRCLGCRAYRRCAADARALTQRSAPLNDQDAAAP